MAARATWNPATRVIASRLRPLYPGMSDEEFERMVSRIAEIELYGEPASRPVARQPAIRGALLSANRGGGRAA